MSSLSHSEPAEGKVEETEKQEQDVFEKSIGSFGRWQMWVIFLIFLVKFPIGWQQLNIIIIGPPAKISCLNSTLDKCDPNCKYRIINPDPFTSTIQSEWGLVCNEQYLANLAQTFTMLGILVGNAVFGFWSDRHGRRLPMVVAVIILAISGTALAYVPWLWAFLLLRFIVATATGGTMCTSFVLLMEITGKKWRIVMATLYQIPTWLGHLSLAGIGYYFRDWRDSQLFISLPAFILISYYFVLPESPRYLVSAGKLDEAIDVLVKAAKWNGRQTENIAADIKAFAVSKSKESVMKGTSADLFNSKIMCTRTLILAANWIVCGLCFYGIAQYSGQLGGNVFVNIALSAAIEVPATLLSILFLDKLGRKWTVIGASAVAGIPMLLIPALKQNTLAPTLMAVVAMFGATVLFVTIYIFTGELYPTYIRNVGVGITSMSARFGSIVAPFVSTLMVYDFGVWLAPVIFGLAPLFSGVLAFFLPETKDIELPDTLEEAKNIGRKKS